MSLALNARQRAMLQEMGITVFAPAAAPAATRAPAAQATPAPPAAQPQPAAATRPAAATGRSHAPGAQPTHAPAPYAGLLLHAPVALYPEAPAAHAPPELGQGWLVLLESPTPDAPLDGDMGRLLDNMLRAMRLHLHPRCMAAALQRSAAGAAGPAVADSLGQALATLRPGMVLLLGLNTARAVLGGSDSLAQLRARVHTLADGTPAVVSHDPAHLLRAAHAKPAAWADLCQALALVRRSQAAA